MSLNFNEDFVIKFYDSMSRSENKEVIERINRVFMARLINLMKFDPIRKDNYEMNSVKFELNKNIEVKKIELIGDNYAILTYDIGNKD